MTVDSKDVTGAIGVNGITVTSVSDGVIRTRVSKSITITVITKSVIFASSSKRIIITVVAQTITNERRF